MSLLDLISIAVLVLFFIRGYMKGIIVAVFSLSGILFGILLALKLSGWFSGLLLEGGWVSSGWVQLISYSVIFIGVLLLVRLLAKAVEAVMHLAMLGWINGIVGGLLYGFMALIVWSSVLWIANQMHLISPETKAFSRTYTFIEPLAPWVYEKLGKAVPFAQNAFNDLKPFFNRLNQALPEYVGAAG